MRAKPVVGEVTMKKIIQFVVFVMVWVALLNVHPAKAQNDNESPEDADRAAVVKAILVELISQRTAKRPLNVARGSVDAKLFPSKIGEVEIVLVNAREIEKQEEFGYVEFETFRLRKSGLSAVIARVWQLCSGYSGRNRYTYAYQKVGEKWEGGWTQEVELNSYHGRSTCKKR